MPAVRVDVSSGVSGFLRPGDRVDVYWSGRVDKGGTAEEVTRLIETNVRLVAVDQHADQDQDNPIVARTVTVEADPHQIAALAQAQSTGRLSLALVGVEDDTQVGMVEVDQRELLGIEERKVAEVQQEVTFTVRTRKARRCSTCRSPAPTDLPPTDAEMPHWPFALRLSAGNVTKPAAAAYRADGFRMFSLKGCEKRPRAVP